MRVSRLATVATVLMLSSSALAAPRSGPRSAPRDLTDGDEEVRPAAVADAVALVRAGKPQSASLAIFDLLEDGAFPAHDSELRYHLALALQDLGLAHGAARELGKVVRRGPEDTWFTPALARLSAIAAATGDDAELARIAGKLSPDQVPAGARDQFAYLRGVRLYETGDLTAARAELADVAESSPYAPRARYLTAVALSRQGRARSAVQTFAALAAEPVEGQESIGELATLNVARTYYGVQRFEQADEWYGRVPRGSVYWSQGVFESAWANYGEGELDRTLGQLLTLRAPSVDDATFAPEAQMLTALTWFELCDWPSVLAEVDSFEARYRPMHAEMATQLRQYGSQEGRALAAEAWDRYFGPRPADTELPKAFFAHALRDRELASAARQLEALDAEEALLAAQKPVWRDTLGAALSATLEQDRERLKRRGGLALLGHMADTTAALGDLLDQAQVIRFEVVDRRRVDLNEAIARPAEDLQKLASREDFDYATVTTGHIAWPFNGEFWADELGSYSYVAASQCE